jgi:hypothetical protein
MSSSSSICNITLDEADLKKLEELDPNQNNGFRTFSRINKPILITYANELGERVQDEQDLTFQILVRQLKGPSGNSAPDLETMQIYLTSETDLHFNFMSQWSQQTFDNAKNKNGLNIKFNDLPNVISTLLSKSGRKYPNHYSATKTKSFSRSATREQPNCRSS